MSILQDLDPQNAKIHDPGAAAGKTGKIAWMLALLLLLGGSAWLIVGPQPGPQAATSNQVAASAKAPVPVSTIAEAPLPPVPAKAEPAPPAASTAPSSQGSALIRENAVARNASKPDDETGGNAFQSIQKELEKAPAKQPVSGTGQQAKGAKATRPAAQKKATIRATAKKTPKNTADTTANRGTRSVRKEKKSAERDVDIIMAIVK